MCALAKSIGTQIILEYIYIVTQNTKYRRIADELEWRETKGQKRDQTMTISL